jgi:hypothetical protein
MSVRSCLATAVLGLLVLPSDRLCPDSLRSGRGYGESAEALAKAEGGSTFSGGRSLTAAEPLFIESAAATGLAFTHVNGATGKYYLPEQMGAGVALFDYDNDGDLDVFLVQDGPLADGTPPGSGDYPTSRLFRNDLTRGTDGTPRLHFTDVTARAGVGLRA